MSRGLLYRGFIMRTAHHPHGFGKTELLAMAQGQAPERIDDMEFLETLAQRRCLVMPPWVYHIKPGGIIVVDDSWRYPKLRQENRAQKHRIFQSVGPCRPGVTSTDIFFY